MTTVAAGAGMLALTLFLAGCGEDDPRTRTDAAGGKSPGTSTAPTPSPSGPPELAPASPQPFPTVSGGVDQPMPPSPPAPGDMPQLARDEAARAADAWEQAQKNPPAGPVFVVASPLSEQKGNWEPQNGAFKASLIDGCFEMRSGATVPPHPAQGEIRRADGTVFTRPFLAPQESFGRGVPPELRARCGTASTPKLPVTGISLTSGTVATTNGPATVPVWELTFEGTAVRGQAIAVTSDPAPPRLPVSGMSGPVASGKVTLSPDGRTVTISFFGSPDRPGPCGEGYTAETVQRAGVVVVAIVRHPREAPTGNVACTLEAAIRTVSVTLDAPLGSRALINTLGEPVTRAQG